ncbi:VOC family protein [Microbulbifer halophilus]|uniref:VOC family protein n=1 Tax=Microbulbifer halophilus TaxID=453963 RepID=A0ABW5EJ81_9GAMM|nr:VOC family protein [Microbulbifer halophilus]MCW8127309.1 VOC family protein [Microbulbifer halophilus]
MPEREVKPVALGINHVALDVRDIDEELDFLDQLFRFELRGRGEGMAFIELGDQFLALFESIEPGRDGHRHFGLVVDDKAEVEARLQARDIPIVSERFLDFHDPSGNRWQIVDYREIQFIKHPQILASLGRAEIRKTGDALEQLRNKGIEL